MKATFNQIIILGAGAIGSALGALLSKKNDVTLIGNKAHVDAVNSKGLKITGDVNGIFHLEADTEIHEIPEETLIVLTTKAYDSKEAMQRIDKLLKKDTVVLVLQNGLGNEEIVKKATTRKIKILRAITAMAVESFKPGEIRYWRGETIIERDVISEKIAEIFNSCSLKTSLADDMANKIWCKLLVNCVVGPLTAVFRVRNHEILRDSLAAVRHHIVRECMAVGKAEAIAFQEGLEKRVDEEISKYTNFSSMCQDIMKGNKTEIDFLNEKIVELGKKNQIPTPMNETFVSIIKFMEERNELSTKD
jgi:2-dehydropantoate 2-reductase